MKTVRRTLSAAVATATMVMLVLAVDAEATAPPVGPLPPGPTSTIRTTRGQLLAVALPARGGGRAWRVARAFDSSVVKQVSEANVGNSVVLVFRAASSGKTVLRFALTRGERPKAYESRSVTVRVG